MEQIQIHSVSVMQCHAIFDTEVHQYDCVLHTGLQNFIFEKTENITYIKMRTQSINCWDYN